MRGTSGVVVVLNLSTRLPLAAIRSLSCRSSSGRRGRICHYTALPWVIRHDDQPRYAKMNLAKICIHFALCISLARSVPGAPDR
jgi:hypothetical protein